MPAIKESPQTHADRPTPKASIPFRFVHCLVGGKQEVMCEWDVTVPVGKGSSTTTLSLMIETPQSGCFHDPLAFYIKQLADMYWGVESRVDGLMAAVDKLTTDNRLKDGEISSLKGKLSELQARSERNGSAKGK